ncbi:MAG: tryptophan--tRNA ligase, partial [Clostridia bacterium]|nr:tryptophan--tRNA ligase [Clostridia bacterium]
DPNPNGFIKLLETKDDTIRKFKRAVTDSDNEIRKSPDKPGISNLLDIYCAVTGKTTEEAEAEFSGKGYGDFKLAVGETVADSLGPIRAKFDQLSKDKSYVEEIYKNGAQQANYIAQRVLGKVYKKVGFIV